MDSGVVVWGFWFILLSVVASWAVSYIITKRALRLGKAEKQELAAARASLKAIEKDATEYRSDLLSDLILAHVEKYKYRELE